MSLKVRKNRVVIPPACPIDEGLQLLVGAWAPQVIVYLSAQPRRFGELRKDLPGISARVLSARLRELQARGVVSRTPLATSPPSAEYALTELGHEFLPAIQAIVRAALKLQRVAAETALAAAPDVTTEVTARRRPRRT